MTARDEATARPWESSAHWNPHGGSVVLIDGRLCQLGQIVRVRRDPRRPHFGFIDKMTVRFLDSGESQFGTVAQFNRRGAARAALAAAKGGA